MKLQNKMQESSKTEEAMDSRMRKYVEIEIEKFNAELGMDNPLDVGELEHFVGEIH